MENKTKGTLVHNVAWVFIILVIFLMLEELYGDLSNLKIPKESLRTLRNPEFPKEPWRTQQYLSNLKED